MHGFAYTQVAFYRIKETAIGICIALAVQLPLLESGHASLRRSKRAIITALAADIQVAFTPWTSKDGKGEDKASPTQPKAGALVAAALAALPGAAFEPVLWRKKFSKIHQEKYLRTIAQLVKYTATIGSVARRESGASDFPPGAIESFAKIGKVMNGSLVTATGTAHCTSLSSAQMPSTEALLAIRKAIIKQKQTGTGVSRSCCFAYMYVKALMGTFDQMAADLHAVAAAETERGISQRNSRSSIGAV